MPKGWQHAHHDVTPTPPTHPHDSGDTAHTSLTLLSRQGEGPTRKAAEQAAAAAAIQFLSVSFALSEGGEGSTGAAHHALPRIGGSDRAAGGGAGEVGATAIAAGGGTDSGRPEGVGQTGWGVGGGRGLGRGRGRGRGRGQGRQGPMAMGAQERRLWDVIARVIGDNKVHARCLAPCITHATCHLLPAPLPSCHVSLS